MQPILEINLSTNTCSAMEIPQSWTEEYLGGASLAARLLYDSIIKPYQPFDPEAPLLFMTGPLTGTSGPAVGRFVVCGKSPATHIWAESNCGGFWGPELRRSGYDGLLIRGKAEKPIYIVIDRGNVTVRNAETLWGMETYQARDAILAESGEGGFHVAVIGPAGEQLIPYSLILTDHGRVAGRTGMGALMGAKNIKGIAVRGDKSIPITHPEDFHQLRSELNRELRNDNKALVLRELGTASIAEYFDYLGLLPKRYYQQSQFDGIENVSGSYVAQTMLKGVSACHACVIACGRVVQLDGDKKRKGAEYESIVGFGPNLLISNIQEITLLAEQCDRLGMDSISASNTIGLAIHLFEQGKITSHDTDGLALHWGDAELINKLLALTGARMGFGNLLADGAKALAERFGAPEEAVQVKGLEAAYHDPRGGSGMALVYATSPRGACHNQSDYFFVEIGQTIPAIGIQLMERHAGKEKAENVARHQDWRTVFNSLVMCLFADVSPEKTAELIYAATGLEMDVSELIKIGERGWNLKRMIDVHLGIRAQDDTLPKVFMNPYNDGIGDLEGYAPDFAAMLQEYYKLRGWDILNGIPEKEKLENLGLGFTLEKLPG